jgi:hypothetical protein
MKLVYVLTEKGRLKAEMEETARQLEKLRRSKERAIPYLQEPMPDFRTVTKAKKS